MITFQELVDEIKEINIVYNIINNVKEGQLLDELDKIIKWNEIIRKYNNNWEKISQHATLSEDFIREYQDKVLWWLITYNQELSEDFIREFQDYVDWYGICQYQNISEGFIREFQDKVSWNLGFF